LVRRRDERETEDGNEEKWVYNPYILPPIGLVLQN